MEGLGGNSLKIFFLILTTFITYSVMMAEIKVKGRNFLINDLPFFPVGINRFMIYVASNNRNNWKPEEYLQKLKESGIKVVRIFVPESSFEYNLGNYDKKYVDLLDEFFRLAEKYNIYVVMPLFDHYSFRYKWDESSYNVKNGGIVENPIELYTNSKAIFYEKKRIEFLVNRYKDSSALLAWEVINELDGIAPFFFLWKKQALKWFKEMKNFIKILDPHHLITESLTGNKFCEELNEEVDVIQIHTYKAKSLGDIPKIVERYINLTEQYKKPVIIGEFAPKRDWSYRKLFIRNFLWSFVTAKIPCWLWTHKNDAYGDMNDEDFETYKAFTKFLENINITKKYLGRAEDLFKYDGYLFAGKFEGFVIGYIPRIKGNILKVKESHFKEFYWINPETGGFIEKLDIKEEYVIPKNLKDVAFLLKY